jgi:two-component system, chemotaxis family, sensor kinase Cph1
MSGNGTSVDLDACDTEPIHIIGTVQPHGALIAADADSLLITHASANTASFIGRRHDELLGLSLGDLLGDEQLRSLLKHPLKPQSPDLLRPIFMTLKGADGVVRQLETFAHRLGDQLILELVRTSGAPESVWQEDLLRQRIISELIKPDTLGELARVAAQMVREVTGFDRVMVYRFHDDKHGEVIAEDTSRPDSFLGLHYPASDIPDPARRHFVLNLIRAIPDINAVPVPIFARSGAVADATSQEPLDLTFSKLRGVAPVHIEYLNNMGVGASMSISLTANDELWGLIACHHYGPLEVPWSRLRFCEMLGGTVSALLQSLENSMLLKRSIRAEKIAFDIEQTARSGVPLRKVVSDNAAVLMTLAGAQGMALVIDGKSDVAGHVPASIPGIELMAQELEDGVAATDRLPEMLDMSTGELGGMAGAAFLELSGDSHDYLVFLREEYEQAINWAGKPEKQQKRLADGTLRLSPRGSFALWREERDGLSQPFTPIDREVLRILRRALFALNSLDRERAAVSAQREAEAEESRMRMVLLDETRRSSMGELASALAHELNQPLAAVTNYVNACRQELRNYGVEVPSRVDALIESAIAESARAAKLVRRLRNFVAKGELVAETLDIHEVIRQGVNLALEASRDAPPRIELDFDHDLPKIWADPVQIGQVVLNLVRNALAAMAEMDERLLTIATRREADEVTVSFRDTGVGIPADRVDKLFEPFHSSTTRGMGVGLSLCRSIIEAHSGRIALRPRNRGTEIVFSLPLHPREEAHG